MHLFADWLLGTIILVLLGALVVVKGVATGTVLDKPVGNFLVQFVNTFNLFFLLVVNPLAALLLLSSRLATVDPIRMSIVEPWAGIVVNLAGLVLYVAGFVLMGWALITLGNNYQIGGTPPRSQDTMVVAGPYVLIRHPMYASALSISLGLACLTESWGLACVFFVYLVLILLLIPLEERRLHTAYGEQFAGYQHKVRKLIPFVY